MMPPTFNALQIDLRTAVRIQDFTEERRCPPIQELIPFVLRYPTFLLASTVSYRFPIPVCRRL